MILHHTILSGGLVNVYSIYLQWKFYCHTSYVLVVQESCLIETSLLRTQNMCCGLVKGGLDDVYSIYLEVLYPSLDLPWHFVVFHEICQIFNRFHRK